MLWALAASRKTAGGCMAWRWVVEAHVCFEVKMSIWENCRPFFFSTAKHASHHADHCAAHGAF